MNAMSTMELEFPLLTMAIWMSNLYKSTYASAGCSSFYTNQLNFTTPSEVDSICNSGNTNFNFAPTAGPHGAEYFDSSLALLTLYYYDNKFDIANADYFGQF